VSVSVPPLRVSPPLPDMLPSKVPVALESVSDCAPRTTFPEPDSVEMAGYVAEETSKTPLSTNPLDSSALPLPDSARVAPEEIVVRPV